jgi:hypothetical protein
MNEPETVVPVETPPLLDANKTTYDNDYLWPAHETCTSGYEILVRLAIRTLSNANLMGLVHFDKAFYLERLHISEDDFDQAFEALEKSGEVFKYVRETDELMIKNYIPATYHSITKEKREAILAAINEVKSEEIIEYFYKSLKASTKELRGKDALLKAMKKTVKSNAIN